MEPNRFSLHRRAIQALDALPPEERQLITAALELYAQIPRQEWCMGDFEKISETEPLYLLKIPPRLRLFVRMKSGSPPEVEDVVYRETLAMFLPNSRGSERG